MSAWAFIFWLFAALASGQVAYEVRCNKTDGWGEVAASAAVGAAWPIVLAVRAGVAVIDPKRATRAIGCPAVDKEG